MDKNTSLLSSNQNKNTDSKTVSKIFDANSSKNKSKENAKSSHHINDFNRSKLLQAGQSHSTAGESHKSQLSYLEYDINDIKDSVKAAYRRNNPNAVNNKLESARNRASTSRDAPMTKGKSLVEHMKAFFENRSKSNQKKKKADEILKKNQSISEITKCIVYNSLNKLNIVDDVKDLVNDHIENHLFETINPDGPIICKSKIRINLSNVTSAKSIIKKESIKNIEDDSSLSKEETTKSLDAPLNTEQRRSSRIINTEGMHDSISNIIETISTSNDQLIEIVRNRSTVAVESSQQVQPQIMSVQNSTTQSSTQSQRQQNESPPPSVVFVRLNLNLANPDVIAQNIRDLDPFPNWLLNLLEQQTDDLENHDEPHFYCQGDGLGVHPSIIRVDIDTSSSESFESDDMDTVESSVLDDHSTPLSETNETGINELRIIGRNVTLLDQNETEGSSEQDSFQTTEETQ